MNFILDSDSYKSLIRIVWYVGKKPLFAESYKWKTSLVPSKDGKIKQNCINKYWTYPTPVQFTPLRSDYVHCDIYHNGGQLIVEKIYEHIVCIFTYDVQKEDYTQLMKRYKTVMEEIGIIVDSEDYTK